MRKGLLITLGILWLIYATSTAWGEEVLVNECENSSAPVLLLSGYAAPFQGWLLSPCRAANLAAKIEALEKLIALERAKSLEEVAALEQALSYITLQGIKATTHAGQRSWWERHTTEVGLIGVGLGIAIGVVSCYALSQIDF
jgi:hypothetical protein